MFGSRNCEKMGVENRSSCLKKSNKFLQYLQKKQNKSEQSLKFLSSSSPVLPILWSWIKKKQEKKKKKNHGCVFFFVHSSAPCFLSSPHFFLSLWLTFGCSLGTIKCSHQPFKTLEKKQRRKKNNISMTACFSFFAFSLCTCHLESDEFQALGGCCP